MVRRVIFASARLSLGNIRLDVGARTVVWEELSPSVVIPFSVETKRILQCAAQEADDVSGLTALPLGSKITTEAARKG